jgi:8-oxo-dGTP pyrophosphatase MutT (NUDIX family)
VQNLLRHWADRLVLRGGGPDVDRQAGAIPYMVVDGQVVFLLVTSRGSGRWIFPKGELMEGLEPWEAAALEALEEAGVEGEIDPRPLGRYRAMKSLAIRRKVIEIEMYPLRVTRQLDDWAEKKMRHRHWAILPEAKRLLSDPEVAELAMKLSQRVRAESQPAAERISR